MYATFLGDHLRISLVPWLVGVVAGGGLGYACALGARRLFSISPSLCRPAMLLPWRTVAVTLSLLSFCAPVLVGLGTVAGAIIVGLFVFVFALPFTVTALLEHWYPSPLGVRLIARARTLAVASVAVATATSFAGGGGAGWLVVQGINASDYSQVFEGLSIVVLLALTFDVALGALQVAFSQPPKMYPREVGA